LRQRIRGSGRRISGLQRREEQACGNEAPHLPRGAGPKVAFMRAHAIAPPGN
jgi:hypothetical protein